jgi:hypothetical protein
MAPTSPHGNAFYSGVGLFASMAGFAFTFGSFSKISIPFPWRLVQIGIAIVFFLGALQAFERFFRPERARERSCALSNSTRRKLRVTQKAVMGLAIAGFLAAPIMRAAGAHSSDFLILSSVFVFVGYCLADLCGERSSKVLQKIEIHISA